MTGYDQNEVVRQIVAEHLRNEKGLPVPDQPRSHPCVCGCSFMKHVGDLHKGQCLTTGCRCKRYREDTDWAMAYKVADADRTSMMQSVRQYGKQERDKHREDNPRLPGQWSLGPSSAGRCRREIWYQNMPPADLVRAYSDRNKALLGELLHDAILWRLQALYPWRKFEQWVHVKGLDRPGRLDMYDGITGTVDDLKSHGEYVANQLDADGARLDDWEQAALYGKAKEEAGEPIHWLRLTYIHRDPRTGKPIERGPFRRPYDPEFAENARQKLLEVASGLDLMQAENEAKRAETGDETAWVDPDDVGVLPRDREGPSSDKICENCEFRNHCWKSAEAEENGRSPESWTQLGPDASFTDEPTVWAVRNVAELSDLIDKSTEAKKAAEPLIQGLEKGRYGALGELTVYDRKLPNQDKRKTYVKRTPQPVLEREAERRGEVIELPKTETGGAA